MFSKILVPVDGPEMAEAILPYVTQLARALVVPLVLLTVIERRSVDGAESHYASLFGDMEQRARRQLRAVVMELQSAGVEAEEAIASGKPSDAILDAVLEHGCDLIAMSTHGRNIITRGILGSVTDRVVHTSSVPVVTLTPDRADVYRQHEIRMRKIMVPLDGSPLAETVLPYVNSLAAKMSMEVLLVRVVEHHTAFWLDSYPQGLKEAEDKDRDEAERYLESIAGRLEGEGVSARPQVLTGHPVKEILEYAEHTPHDIIALATHGRTGIVRWAFGSLAEALVRGTGDPVLIVPPLHDDEKS